MKKIIPLSITIVFLLPCPVFANGFRVMSQSTSSASMGDAMSSHYEDASSVYFNPATITKATHSQLLMDLVTFSSTVDYHNGNTNTKTKSITYYIPHLNLVHKFTDKIYGGFATVHPYGLAKEWPENWAGRYLSTKASLATYTLNPNVAIKILPNLSVGAGVSYMKSDVIMQQKVNSSLYLPGAEDINSKLEGDGDGWGYNFGILYDITDKVRFGASYRSSVEVKYSGRANFYIPASAAPLAPIFADQDIKSKITFPAIVLLGMGVTLGDWDVDFTADWTEWSDYDMLVIEYANGTKTYAPKEYRDAWAYHIGAKYRVTDSFSVRFGYFYDFNPVPSKTVDPLLSSADLQGFGIGCRYHVNYWALNLGYQFDLFRTRTVNDNINGFNGSYESTVHVAGASYEYNF